MNSGSAACSGYGGFDVDSDSSVPTWWSSALPWWGLTAVFVAMSIEEVAAVHENVGGVLGGAIRGRMNLTNDVFH
jgi:hypothetical protein